MGVLVHRSGRRELLLYERDDADECAVALDLSVDDARTLAELLGLARIVEK